MRASGVIEDDPDAAVERYFAQCSVEVDADALAVMAATLANGGVNPVTRQRAMSAASVRSVLSVMASCGMYDGAGDWLVTVGLPAKSGVSGGILAVVPGQLGIAVFSPPLDHRGNSVRGVAVCRELATALDLHLVGRGQARVPPVRVRDSLARRSSKRVRPAAERSTLSIMGGQAEVRELQGDLTFLAIERATRGLEDPVGGPRWIVLDLRRATTIETAGIELVADVVEAVRNHADRDLMVSGGTTSRDALDELDHILAGRGQRPVARHADADAAREWCEDQIIEASPPAAG